MTATTTVTPTGTWNVDPAHSSVEFHVKHLGIATVRGAFRKFAGTLELSDDLSAARAYGTVEAASLDTNEADRDTHLRSADFFDVENHAQIAFESTAIEAIDDDTYRITGRLTMHGVTGEIELKAELTGTEDDPWGNERLGLEVSGQLNRSDYEMKFNQALGSGNVLVSDRVKLHLDISAVKQGH